MNVAIILARGGSKGVPGKNIRPLAGKPLIVWSIEQALASRCVDAVYVSTDDEKIAAMSLAAGAQVIERPAELANDTASSEAGLQHALEVLEARGTPASQVIFLQCTSPIRQPDDIDRAFATYQAQGADSLLSVSPSHAFLWTQGEDGFGHPVNYNPHQRPRRQDMQPQYRENGSLYIFSRETFARYGNRLGSQVALHIMSEAAAWEIDSETDFTILAALMGQAEV